MPRTRIIPPTGRGVKTEGALAVAELFAGLEGPALLWIQENLRGPLDELISGYTRLGNIGLLWLVLSAAMLLWRPTRKAGAAALLAMLLGLLVTNVTIKPLLSRTRPWLDVPGLEALVEELDPNSFPSGHSCAAFAAAVSWRRELPWKWAGRLAVALAVCMALSRLYVGVHYPTDVLAGSLIGCLCGWCGGKLLDKWHTRKMKNGGNG